MAISREIEDIVRTLVHHEHDHPPVRDLNSELDRRQGLADRTARDLGRLVGSWSFLLLQASLVVVSLVLNGLAGFNHWDPYPFQLLNLVLSLEAALGISLVLMAHNRLAHRARREAQNAFEINAKGEEEMRAIMEHLEAQDEMMLQIIYRLERSDRELHRLTRAIANGPAA